MLLLLLLFILLVVFLFGVVYKKFVVLGFECVFKVMLCFVLLDRGNGGGILYIVMEMCFFRINFCFFFIFNFNILCFYFEFWFVLELVDVSNCYSED